MSFFKKVKYFSAFALFVALLVYLTYTGITGYLAREIIQLPVIKDFNSPETPEKNTVNIQNQLDSESQRAVDKFMQEFNIPLTKRDDFIKQAKDIVHDVEEPNYQIVPPEQEKNKDKTVPPETLNKCFERVITECT
ncbi:hypothetical protein HZA97_07325 [Candidatus Woesearchaeota archaeon]|nr:hypothetical protein [Candidatus Woesearchaeota archaeon]